MRVSSLESTPWHSTPLLELLPPEVSPFAWLGFHRSMVAWGTAASWEDTRADAIVAAGRWWDALRTKAHFDAPEGAPRRAVAFGSFGFAATTSSTLVVPQILIVEEGGTRWAISAGLGKAPDPLDLLAHVKTEDPQPPQGVRTDIGRMTQAEWTDSVDALVGRLVAGDASKAVMTRDMLVRADTPIDPRFLLARLNQLYPTTWRFAVDGLIGASPEMLASALGGVLRSRVLAGTAPAGCGDELLSSPKNLREHEIAVESVTNALAPLVQSLAQPSGPFILDLPNVAHLATDVSATLGEVTLLDAVGALHPTAAVCGTPRADALALLMQLERTERGRYSGPVGWVDTSGEGEFCIALRCGRLEDAGHSVRVFAGAGIMPDSDPGEELIETRRKMTPLLDALGVDPNS